MIHFALVCLILCMGLQYGAGNPVTDQTSYAYSREVDAWLGLHTTPATFWDAYDICEQEGGVLASPTTDAMVQAMRAAMTDHNLDSSNVFAGIAAQANGGTTLSIPLSVALVNLIRHCENKKHELIVSTDANAHHPLWGSGSYRRRAFNKATQQWAANEPSNADHDEQCLALTGASTLVDVSCARAHPYFCRKEPAHKCGALGNGYAYEPRTDSCYKFHRVAKSWRSAVAACHAEGGDLAIINNAIESTVLKEIYDKNPEDTITGADERKHAFIGFRKWHDGEWATLYGASLDEAGFTGWDIGEPTSGKEINDESCGSIHRNGLINDAFCSEKCPFICEINLK